MPVDVAATSNHIQTQDGFVESGTKSSERGKLENFFRQRFLRLAHHAVSEAADLDPLDHQGMKGTLREIVIGQLFRPVLPPEVQIATGKVVAHTGATSSQVDLVLYSPTILPPALYDEKNGFVPVESALYTIEVKSRLTAEGVAEAVANAQSVRRLPTLSTEHWLAKGCPERPIERVLTATAHPVNALFDQILILSQFLCEHDRVPIENKAVWRNEMDNLYTH